MAQAGLAASAVKNPIFQSAAKEAAFQAISREETDEEKQQRVPDGVSEEAAAGMHKWARIIRLSMLVVSTLMIITAFYNLGSSSNSVSTNFLAIYVFFFSCLICCYELAFKQVAYHIVQNFGFMYTAVGRSIFLTFVAILCFQLSTMGMVMFALLVVMGAVQVYVNFRYPQFEAYMRNLHFKGAPLEVKVGPVSV